MPTPLRQTLALLTLASLTLLPPLTMAQMTAPLPPAEPMAQEVGALWDPATITPLKLLNIDLFSRSELGQPVVVQPVIPYPSVGGGSFAYCLETLDGLQSRLVEGIVCTDGFTLVRSLEMTFDEALALQAQFDISSGPAPVRRPTEFSWATFWTDTVVDPIHDLTETEPSRRADWYDAVYPAAQDHELKLWLPAPADAEATDPTVVADPTNQRPVLTDIVGVAGVAMTTGAGTDDAETTARFTLDGVDPATEFSNAYCGLTDGPATVNRDPIIIKDYEDIPFSKLKQTLGFDISRQIIMQTNLIVPRNGNVYIEYEIWTCGDVSWYVRKFETTLQCWPSGEAMVRAQWELDWLAGAGEHVQNTAEMTGWWLGIGQIRGIVIRRFIRPLGSRSGLGLGSQLANDVAPKGTNLQILNPNFVPKPGIGTNAVVPKGIMRPTEGVWPAVMKDGKVYVERFHTLATKAANGGKLGPIDADGFVTLDELGNVIRVNWGWTK